MRKIAILVAVLSLPLLVLAYGQADPPQLRVRVSSSIPGQEIQFAAAYVFQDADSSLETMEAATPLELERNAPLFAGIFRQGSDTPDRAVLEVRLFKLIRGEWREMAMGDGTTIVLNEHDGQRSVSGW